jgi:hypothetical protein
LTIDEWIHCPPIVSRQSEIVSLKDMRLYDRTWNWTREMEANKSSFVRKSLWTTFMVCILAGISAVAAIAVEEEIPIVSAEIGKCSVQFTVRDSEKKPLYNAKIRAVIRYGLMNMRKVSIEVGTNSDGKAQVSGLPYSPKKEFAFEITSGNFLKIVTGTQSQKCEDDKIEVNFTPQDLLQFSK